jgi:hypothetical protein
MKSQVPGDLALLKTVLLNSLSDLPVPLSIVPANTLFRKFIKWRPVRAICFFNDELCYNCAIIVGHVGPVVVAQGR